MRLCWGPRDGLVQVWRNRGPEARLFGVPGWVQMGPGRLVGAPSASVSPRNINQTYGQWAEGSIPVFGPPWKVGKRRFP